MGKKGRIFSGMRPTGKLHLGHLVGCLENWEKLQNQYECIYGIVDWHALTTAARETSDLAKNVREMVLDWLAVGLDPDRSLFMRQSFVLEHAELHVLLSMITPTPWLTRNPTLKEQARDLGLIRDASEEAMATIDYGYLGYPVLQAADILVYRGDTVPVGGDQAPHLEICREIARRFNHIYGYVFPEPQTLLTETPRLLGFDGHKMSKSRKNVIFLDDEPDTIQQQTRRMITDTQKIRLGDPGKPDVCGVFSYHQTFNAGETTGIRRECEEGRLGCGDCKKNLAEKLSSHMSGYRERRKEYAKDPELPDRILRKGSDQAREIASETMQIVRSAVGIL